MKLTKFHNLTSSSHFLNDIVYQQQHKSLDSNACLSVRSLWVFCDEKAQKYLIHIQNFKVISPCVFF